MKAYKQAKIQWEQANKPEMKIGDTIRQFDKIEAGRCKIQKGDIFKFTINTWDILQVGHNEIYDETKRPMILKNIIDENVTERSEIQDKQKFKLGEIYIRKFSFKIPKDFPLIANRLVIGQRKQLGKPWKKWINLNPFVSQRFKRGKLMFTINNSWDITGNRWTETLKQLSLKNLLGKRVDMGYQMKLSGEKDGYIKITMNDENILDYHWPVTSNNKDDLSDEVYFKFGLYRDNYDYGIKRLQKNNEEEKNENIEQEIADIKKAKEDEKNGHPMTIYFKNYSVKKL